MQRMSLKASTTVQELGAFVALVATYEKDRSGDLVQPGAFGPTIARWKASGRPIPLHWNHRSSDPADIVGTVDPASMRETSEGLVVEGELDLENSARAREAWRLVKADSVGVSFGYTAETEQLEDGTRLLTDIDLFEVSLTPAPMNPDARVLDWKSATNGGADDSDGLRAIAWKTAIRELPPQLVGTAWDPTVARDEIEFANEVEIKSLLTARKKAERKALPVRVFRFKV